MKKDSLAGPVIVGLILIVMLPGALLFMVLNAMTVPDGGVLTDCVVTDYVIAGRTSEVNVDYVNAEGKTINARISNGVGGKSVFVGEHYDCYVYEDNPFEVYRKPDGDVFPIIMLLGAAASLIAGIILVIKMMLKRGVQGYLIKNGTQGQCTITNVVIKGGGRDGFTQCVCDYSFTDSYGQMHTGKHTFLPNKRVSIGNYFPVMYAEKNGKMLSDIIE